MLRRASRLGNVIEIEIVIAGRAAVGLVVAAAVDDVAAVADAGITDVVAVTAAMVVMEAVAKNAGGQV